MNAPRAWVAALLAAFTSLAVAACTSPGRADLCNPPCRSGFACVMNACVSACNPPCAAGQRCEGAGAAAACVNDDAGVRPDAVTVMDAAPDDSGDAAGPPPDVTGGGDATVSDAPGPGDAGDGAPPDAAPPCGGDGEPCCGTSYCAPGAECVSMVCRAYPRSAGECVRPADCPAGQACGGPQACDGHGCFRCAASTGALAYGASCTAGTECATGVCHRGHCFSACPLGAGGDAECIAQAPGHVCTQLNYRVGAASDGGMASTVALGICRRGCARNADCGPPEVCIPLLNTPVDRLDFVCGTSTGAGAAGAPCTSGSDCQSFLCLPGSGPGGTAACTAPCTLSADCPAAAPMCVDLFWYRPSGGTQPGRGCVFM